jgi:GH24 family phage-related lysozyme (muramidase)
MVFCLLFKIVCTGINYITVMMFTITQEQADEYLITQLKAKYIPQLSKIPTWFKLNDNQKSAVISFGFNLVHFSTIRMGLTLLLDYLILLNYGVILTM